MALLEEGLEDRLGLTSNNSQQCVFESFFRLAEPETED